MNTTADLAPIVKGGRNLRPPRTSHFLSGKKQNRRESENGNRVKPEKETGSNRRLGPDLCPPELRFDPFPWPLIWAGIVSALEKVKGENWAELSGRHGDWGRDAALWLGRKRGRYKLSQLGQLAGGMDDAAVGQAVSRFDKRIATMAT